MIITKYFLYGSNCVGNHVCIMEIENEIREEDSNHGTSMF